MFVSKFLRSTRSRKMAQPSRNIHFWLRSESKHGEHRTMLLPSHVQKLLQSGHSVTVEEYGVRSIFRWCLRSKTRCIPLTEYVAIPGVKIAPEGSWTKAPEGTVISGLKELPEDGQPITGTHVYFAHCFKACWCRHSISESLGSKSCTRIAQAIQRRGW